jgi:ABC-type polysaccharide/polyol phosphate transport system ATPase subunit
VSSLSASERPRILVEDVSLTYRTSLERKPTLQSTILRLGRRERIIREVEALKHVSFQVPHGQVLGGLAAGLSRERLAEKYEEIVDFAELDEFMDMPMRTYSSGMYGRLGFSVAVNMQPDILLIDEALSVGDARFRRKSFRRMRQLCREDRTILLVSHALGSIEKLCDECIWLDKGELRMWDEPSAVVEAYTEFLGVHDEDEEPDPVTMEDV